MESPATILAMLAQNSPLDIYYDTLLSVVVDFRSGKFKIAKPLLLKIHDGLKATFLIECFD